jgi:hypothetical protein
MVFERSGVALRLVRFAVALAVPRARGISADFTKNSSSGFSYSKHLVLRPCLMQSLVLCSREVLFATQHFDFTKGLD